jgi:hypothetical protein
MKKSIGLTANISEYRPNLPQTKHLNYFMGTNPVHMANGGDVRAGIPSYPDANVTRGFLPAALGFDNGGDVGFLEQFKNLLKQFDNDLTKFMAFLQNMLGYTQEEAQDITNKITGEERIAPKADEVWPTKEAEPDEPKDGVFKIDQDKLTEEQKTWLPKFQGSEQGKAIADAFDYAGQGSGQSTGAPTVTPIDTGKAPERIAPKADEVWPTQEGGITEISPAERFKPEEKDIILPDAEKAGMLDLNGDGVIDGRDLEIAIQKFPHLVEWIKKYIKGFTEGDQEDKPLEKDIVVPEGLPPSHPDSPGKKSIVPEEKIIPKIKPEPDEPIIPKGGITSIEELPISHTEHPSKKIGKDEQTLLKMPKNIEETDKTKGKGLQKDIPPWAIPLMSAGFKMMASKSPYFMQALGEAGEKGIETYTGIKEAKTAKEKSEAETELAKAQAAYARGEGRQTGKGTYVHNGMLYKADGSPLYLDTPDKGKIHAPAALSFQDAALLAPKYYGTQWDMMDENQRTQAIFTLMEMYKNQAAGMTPSAPEPTTEDKGPGILENLWKYGKGFIGKDGGIVSLRR